MKLFTILLTGLFFMAVACTSKKKPPPDNSTDLQCANAFIRSLFDGDFERAALLLAPGAENEKHLQTAKFNFKQATTGEEREKYRGASVILLNKESIDEATTVFKYRDPVKNITMPPLKLVKTPTGWLVDFSYSFSGNL